MDNKKIFISYRRSDSQFMVDELYEILLKNEVAKESIFKDIESIQIGVNFDEAIDNALAQSDIVLIIMGKTWFSEENKQRLNDPNDFVRREIAKSLRAKDKLVIPVLFDSEMPPVEELPEDLKDLTRKNAFVVSRKYKNQDINDLLKKLQLGKFNPKKEISTSKKRNLLLIASLAVLLILTGIFYFSKKTKTVKNKLPNTEAEKFSKKVNKKFSPDKTAKLLKTQTFPYTSVDAAFYWPEKSKIFFFQGSSYVRYDAANNSTDKDYPADFATYWPGILNTPKIDAVLKSTKYKAIYFFVGEQYDKWLTDKNKSGSNFPKNIAQSWPGIFSADNDACFMREATHTAYFFKNDKYLEYDMASNMIKDGFPKKIDGNWGNLPWKAGIDAAFAIKNTAYFFKGTRYVKYDLLTRKLMSKPQPINKFSL